MVRLRERDSRHRSKKTRLENLHCSVAGFVGLCHMVKFLYRALAVVARLRFVRDSILKRPVHHAHERWMVFIPAQGSV
jgi:hypothetical protein